MFGIRFFALNCIHRILILSEKHEFFGIFVNFYCLNIIFLVALENLIYK